MVKVKICGITNKKDALKAINFGADYVGFLVEIDFAEDKVTREKAKEIIGVLPTNVKSVFVTYLQKAEPIVEIARMIRPAVIQLHNYIALGEIMKIRKLLPRIELIKAVSVLDGKSITEAKKFERYVDFILLDTKIKGKKGGTGKVHDWNLSAKIVKEVKKPVFLAGGLNPENIKKAIMEVRPYGVDTNSGVKLRARKKSYKKLRRFIERAKSLGG